VIIMNVYNQANQSNQKNHSSDKIGKSEDEIYFPLAYVIS